MLKKFFIIICFSNYLISQDYKIEELMNVKWHYQGSYYFMEGNEVFVDKEKKRKNDFFILRENNSKEELIYGKKIKNQWEHAPHGKILMFYDNSDEKISAIPLRISKLERDESGKIKMISLRIYIIETRSFFYGIYTRKK